MRKLLKTTLLTLVLIAVTGSLSAQLLPLSLGLKGGLNTSNTDAKDSKARAGFNAGLTLDLYLPANLVILSGIELSTKGANDKRRVESPGDLSIEGTYDRETKMNMMYLQVPVKLGYRIKTIPGLGLHFGAGPYFAQGIGGKTKVISNGKETYKENTFGDKDGQLKKMDWGLGVEVGASVLGLVQVRTGYDFGLANISRDKDNKVRNRNFYVSAGIKFF